MLLFYARLGLRKCVSIVINGRFNTIVLGQLKNKNKNLELLNDLDAKGYSSSLVTCEISSLGHSLPECHKAIQKLFPQIPRSDIRTMFDAAAKIAISTSFSIFLARKDLCWPLERPLLTE